jgi:tripartite-type tricarboxylate transporter receptor subunit TctC
MSFSRNRIQALAASAFIATGLTAPAVAQSYPSQNVNVMVAFPAGGLADIIGRLVASKLEARLKQSFVVENRGGAGGTIATRQVAKSEPDGYTLLIATSSLAINPSLYPNVGYDPRKDFAAIGLIATSSNIVLVHPAVRARTIAELIALAKEQPGKLDFASTGNGSSVQLSAELFAAMAGIKLNHVPYKGSAPALNDLVGGHVAMMFSTMASAVGLARSDKVRALAVTGAKRSQLFPDLPTVAEAGRPGYAAELHYGIVAPAGTPRPIVEKLNAALKTALADDEVRRRLATDGAEALPSSPADYAADIASEEAKWSEIIRKASVKGE